MAVYEEAQNNQNISVECGSVPQICLFSYSIHLLQRIYLKHFLKSTKSIYPFFN